MIARSAEAPVPCGLGSGAVAQLIIKRSDFLRGVAWTRRLKVQVDGELVGRLWTGQTVAVEAPQGEHSVQAQLSYLRSPVLTIDISAEDSSVRIEVDVPVSAKSFTLRPRSALICRRI